jgi:hypothetical protein
MGTTYWTTVIVGVQLPLNSMFQQDTPAEQWCHCPKPGNGAGMRYCPTCGRERYTPDAREFIRPDILERFGQDEDSLFGCLLNGLTIRDSKVYLFEDSGGNKVLVSGYKIASFGDPRYEGRIHKWEKLAEIPSEESLCRDLEAAGLTVVPHTYGIHKIVMGN